MSDDHLRGLLDAAKEAEERSGQIEANIAEIDRILTRVKSQRWRYFRNQRLLAESRHLLSKNRRLATMNDLVIMRNAAYLAQRRP